ncbi:hypothetical protein NX059_005258 [Plenodomus lindquistii]|nr:hypothetical protein NX059_005258 [Plenodomus lindquistii]
MSTPVHAVSKLNNAQHTTYHVDQTDLPLAPSSIRVTTHLISLSSNNLTYVRSGTPLHWWDIFPVPANKPSPFNGTQEWGIVPAWGYGRVLASIISSLVPGNLIWGMWPTSSHAVDLHLEATEPSGH